MCAHAKAIADFGPLPLSLSILFPETECLEEPRAQVLGYTDWLESPGILLSLSSKPWGYRCVPTHLTLYVGARDQNSGALILGPQALYPQKPLPPTN